MALDEPVGVFIPDGGIESFDGFGEAVVLEIVLDGFFASGEFAADPVLTEVIGGIRRLEAGLDLTLVDDIGREFLIQDLDSNRGIGMRFVDERLDEARDIPEFIAEIAAGDDGIFGEGLVHASGATAENAEAESVGTVFGDHIHRIDDVAFALGHFLAMSVEHKTVKVDFAEGNFAGDIEAHHDHAGDPSKENIGTGFHDVKRVIGVFLTFGPVGTDDGPVAGAEPGVESVFVAIISDAANFDFGEIDAGVEDPFGCFVSFSLAEHWNSNTPRNLAGDVPVF